MSDHRTSPEQLREKNAEIDRLINENNKGAKKLIDQTLALAQRAGFEEIEIDLRIRQADYAFTFNSDDETEITILHNCAERSRTINYTQGIAQVTIRHIQRANRLGDFKEVVRLANNVLALPLAKFDGSRAAALTMRGYAEPRISQKHTAKEDLEEALAIGRKLDDVILITNAYIMLCQRWRNEGNNEKALEGALKALELLRPTRFYLGAAGATNSIAGTYIFMGNYPKALEYFRQAHQLE